jgi:hypothetical protein
MTTSAAACSYAKWPCFRHIIIAAIVAVSALAADMPIDAQAKQKKNYSASEFAPAATPDAPATSPLQSAADAANAAQSAQKPDDGARPEAAAKADGGAKPDNGTKSGGTKSDTEAAPKPPATWSEAEIADARAHCAVVLKRIHAVALPHEPIKEGTCGAPAPIELVSIGEKPEVLLSPPAIVTCDLAESLVDWFEQDVQPLARKHLKSDIVTIETMSSYSCRNAYGRKKTKLSEHGLANALDIGGFVTASTKTAEVLDDWGKPQREILAEAEAQRRTADEAAAKTAGTVIATNPAQATLPSPMPSTTGAAAAVLARSTIIDGVPIRGGPATGVVATGAPIVPNRLGGPLLKNGKKASLAQKAARVVLAPSPAPDVEVQAFLHEAHQAACRVFGTTLGPEANADHRNHFHVDMAARRFTKICD